MIEEVVCDICGRPDTLVSRLKARPGTRDQETICSSCSKQIQEVTIAAQRYIGNLQEVQGANVKRGQEILEEEIKEAIRRY